MYKGLKLHIKLKAGRWLVNGKTAPEMSILERQFLNDFFKEVKLPTYE